eukprot:746839-Hanusia_phi.AAC.5
MFNLDKCEFPVNLAPAASCFNKHRLPDRGSCTKEFGSRSDRPSMETPPPPPAMYPEVSPTSIASIATISPAAIRSALSDPTPPPPLQPPSRKITTCMTLSTALYPYRPHS